MGHAQESLTLANIRLKYMYLFVNVLLIERSTGYGCTPLVYSPGLAHSLRGGGALTVFVQSLLYSLEHLLYPQSSISYWLAGLSQSATGWKMFTSSPLRPLLVFWWPLSGLWRTPFSNVPNFNISLPSWFTSVNKATHLFYPWNSKIAIPL